MLSNGDNITMYVFASKGTRHVAYFKLNIKYSIDLKNAIEEIVNYI